MKGYDTTVDKMFTGLKAKIERYELIISVNEEIIAKRKQDMKEADSLEIKAMCRSTIRACEAENAAYYHVIRDMKAIMDEAF